MKISPNNPCPCGSNLKYKKCCQRYHKGANALDALTLMKSRYSAYVSRETMYIIKTTHWTNPQFNKDRKTWSKELLDFCKTTHFTKLEIVDSTYHTVTFKAFTEQGVLHEKSSFTMVDGKWYYLDGEIY
ncbi:MAG TPA: zinc chelation protein SecC [Campylobacterales bacterium]|nr:zinc chelation protein SecC [Campylobacterales bacterium]HIP58932.1 zinc chelation protein SecC [Campylobacterales bacterium]